MPSNKSARFVYFVQALSGGPIKIGSANNPQSRLCLLQTGNVERLVLLTYAPGTLSDEHGLHAQFSSTRIRGEWFTPSDDLRSLVATVAETGLLPTITPIRVRSRESSIDTKAFLAEVETFLARSLMSPSTFGRAACRDGKLILDLRRGRRLWPETADKVRAFIATHPVMAEQGRAA